MSDKIVCNYGAGITSEDFRTFCKVNRELFVPYQTAFKTVNSYAMARYILDHIRICHEAEKEIMKEGLLVHFPGEYSPEIFDAEFEEAWAFLEQRLI